jgi:hypothetical protein
MGPFPVIETSFWVREGEKGVFMVGREENRPTFIGQSDNLLIAIENKAKEKKVEWFEFYKTFSAIRAFEVECEWYHKYDELKTGNHPEPPVFAKNLKCPVEGCSLNER